jgi:hypothetical protein
LGVFIVGVASLSNVGEEDPRSKVELVFGDLSSFLGRSLNGFITAGSSVATDSVSMKLSFSASEEESLSSCRID